MLRGRTPEQIQDLVRDLPGCLVTSLGRGSRRGEGLVLREITTGGNLTGRIIQWHPGGGHHGYEPYWKVSSPEGGTIRIGPQFDSP